MNEIRLTLISDTTQEFPDNTNSDFKVHLAEPIYLKAEERWQATLVSLSTQNLPNTPLDRLGLKGDDTLFVYGLRIVNPKYTQSDAKHFTDIQEARVTVKEVFGETINSVTGIEFWSRISYYCNHYQALETLQVAKRENHMVKSYDNEMVITRVEPQLDHFRIDATDSTWSPATFGVNLTVAKYFGLVEESRAGGYVLGINARYEGFPTFEYSRRQRRMKWPIETDMTGTEDAMVVKKLSNGEDMVFFSRYPDWEFSNLSRSFQGVTQLHKTQLALVYCDLVESTLVGNQKHALLREIMLTDSGGHRQSTEPTHYQWLSVRNHVVEVVHVQVANADGRLLSLPSGKTMVTVTLKRAS